MRFAEPLVEGRLVQRYKRFLVDVRLPDGRVVVAHTGNTGRMTGCAEPGSRVWLAPADSPGRKLKWTWELVELRDGTLMAINPLRSNTLVQEAVLAGRLPSLGGYPAVRREVRYGQEGSRIDLLLEDGDRRCWLEVKTATLVDGVTARFPDAPTARGRKHLRELARVAEGGERAVLLFAVLRAGVERVRPADDVDPEYGAELRRAVARGLEAIACAAAVDAGGIQVVRELPVDL